MRILLMILSFFLLSSFADNSVEVTGGWGKMNLGNFHTEITTKGENVLKSKSTRSTGEFVTLEEGWHLLGGIDSFSAFSTKASKISSLWKLDLTVPEWVKVAKENYLTETYSNKLPFWIKVESTISPYLTKYVRDKKVRAGAGLHFLTGVVDLQRISDKIGTYYVFRNGAYEKSGSLVEWYTPVVFKIREGGSVTFDLTSQVEAEEQVEETTIDTEEGSGESPIDETVVLNFVEGDFTDSDFNSLTREQKFAVLDKISEALYFAFSYEQKNSLANSTNAISGIKNLLLTKSGTGVGEAYDKLSDFNFDKGKSKSIEEAIGIFSFLPPSKEYFDYWTTYWLANSKFYSASLELDSVKESTGTNLISWLYNNISGAKEISEIVEEYFYSISFWERFRSREDNLREAFELFLGIFNDLFMSLMSEVYKNIYLNESTGQLVTGLNMNTEPKDFFGTTVSTPQELMTAMANYPELVPWFVNYLVAYYFPEADEGYRGQMEAYLLSRGGETYQDYFFSLFFSREFIMNSNRLKRFEELYLPTLQKVDYFSDANHFKNLKKYAYNGNHLILWQKLGRGASPFQPDPAYDGKSYQELVNGIRAFLLKIKTDLSNENQSGWKFSLVESFDWSDEGDLLDKVFLHLIGRKAEDIEKAYFLQAFEGEDFSKPSVQKKVFSWIFDYISQTPDFYISKGI